VAGPSFGAGGGAGGGGGGAPGFGGVPGLGGGGGGFKPAGGGGFEEEAPLLEELGVDLGGIVQRALGVFTLRVKGDPLEESDLGGPVIAVVALGILHLLTGKVHFGILLGWGIVNSLALFFLVNMLTYPSGVISVHMACSVVGYGLVPQVALAALALVLPKTLLLGAAAVTVLWSSHTATNFVAARLKAQHISFGEQKLLIMFPCLLIYSLFSLLSMY